MDNRKYIYYMEILILLWSYIFYKFALIIKIYKCIFSNYINGMDKLADHCTFFLNLGIKLDTVTLTSESTLKTVSCGTSLEAENFKWTKLPMIVSSLLKLMSIFKWKKKCKAESK